MAWTAKDLTALQNDVYAALRDSERVFIDATTVTSWLNEAYFDLCARLRYPEVTGTGTTSATGTIALPADFVEAKRLYATNADGTEEVLTWVDSDVFLSYSLTGDNPLGGGIFRIWDDTIETYPALESQAYTLEYTGQPTQLSSGTDKPTDLPPELHMRLVQYARGLAKYAEGEMQEGDRYMQQYERGLPDLPRAGWRRVAGPITLIPSPTIVDGEWA